MIFYSLTSIYGAFRYQYLVTQTGRLQKLTSAILAFYSLRSLVLFHYYKLVII